MLPPVSPADILARLMRLFRLSGTDVAARSAAMGPLYALNRNFISNLRKNQTIPGLHHLYAISEIFRLHLGSVFWIFGIDLDLFLDLVDELHQHRTRLLETCPFGGNQMVYVPSVLAPAVASRETAPIWELVEQWTQVSMLNLRNSTWQDYRYRYAKLGVSDTNAAPDIPAGAFVQMRLFEPEHVYRLNRDAFYFVQYPMGYMICRCEYQKGWLYLHPNNPSFSGPKRLHYGKEALILGRVTAFAAALPTVGYQRSPAAAALRLVTPAIAPWDHQSLQSLFSTERLRFQVSSRETEAVSAKLYDVFGIGVNAQYSRRFERSQHVSQTAKALALTAAYAIRISDMFRSGGIPLNNPNKYDLRQLLSVTRMADLPELPASTPVPQPTELWREFIEQWHEWPLLLSRLNPDLRSTPYEIVRLYQGGDFCGLDPLIRPGSLIAIDGSNRHIAASSHDLHAHERDWARRLYVFRVDGHRTSPLICGYLQAVHQQLHLIAHPNAHATPVQAFPRSAVTVIGSVAGIASFL